MYEELVSNRLAQLRMQKGVSARSMSLSLGQSESYVNKIENRKALPSISGLYYICEYFGIHPKDFFDERYVSPQKGDELFNEIKKLNQEQIEHIIAIIKSIKPKE